MSCQSGKNVFVLSEEIEIVPDVLQQVVHVVEEVQTDERDVIIDEEGAVNETQVDKGLEALWQSVVLDVALLDKLFRQKDQVCRVQIRLELHPLPKLGCDNALVIPCN